MKQNDVKIKGSPLLLKHFMLKISHVIVITNLN